MGRYARRLIGQIRRVTCMRHLFHLQAINVVDECQDPDSDTAFDITGPFGTVLTCLDAVCISPNRHFARTPGNSVSPVITEYMAVTGRIPLLFLANVVRSFLVSARTRVEWCRALPNCDAGK